MCQSHGKGKVRINEVIRIDHLETMNAHIKYNNFGVDQCREEPNY